MVNSNILELVNISKSFPGVRALNKVNLRVKKGEVHAIIGENGAGKSTIVKILARIIKEDEGDIIYDGKRIKNIKSFYMQRLGIQFVFQDSVFLNNLTIIENFFRRELKRRLLFIDWNRIISKYKKLLRKFSLNIDLNEKVKNLTPDEIQFLEILRAFTLNPNLIVLDEPTSSLSEKNIKILYELINNAKNNHSSVVYISHKLNEVYDLADRITILRDGVNIKTVEKDRVGIDETISLMVGRKIGKFYYKKETEIGKKLLELKNLNVKDELFDINLTVREGEIVGLSGLTGAGRTELADAIFGLKKVISGDVIFKNKKIIIKSPMQAVKSGIGYLTEDKKSQGLFLEVSVKDNIIITDLKKITKFSIISENKKAKEVKKLIKKLNIITPSINQKVLNLSGGNQQKVVISKWLLLNPYLLILDEPTKGIDVGTKNEVYKIISNLLKERVGIIFISSELPEIMSITDRMYTMYKGKIVKEFHRKEYNEEEITKCNFGIEV